ncbi:NAD-dependent epimerase/dehydratase family protein [Opitutaceae bacterium TAV4]|nr:NAD-dependent epimerase/dehydratase family protein [Opitutaceae bacterium TAV4]
MKLPEDTLTGAVLVTGGTGFLGRRLVERLLGQGREVVVLARRPAPDLVERGVRFVQVALEDGAALEEACRGVETVFHVAARVGMWGRYRDFYRANVEGTRALIAGCRMHGVRRLVYTSTPSVVYNGENLAGADEGLPLTVRCPSPYPLTKAIAEREVLAANGQMLNGGGGGGGGGGGPLRTVALGPHLIWGVGDPHLVPRVLERARAGRLRIVGNGSNRVDMVHVENAVDAHLLAERALADEGSGAGGRTYFVTNGEPVVLWEWINDLLAALGEARVERRVSLGAASAVGVACELAWRAMWWRRDDPPMTRFVAAELAKDHWFSIERARRDLGYEPRVSMEEGTAELVRHLRGAG